MSSRIPLAHFQILLRALPVEPPGRVRHEPHLRQIRRPESRRPRNPVALVKRQLEEPMTRKVPLLVEQPAFHRFHTKQARKRCPVNAEDRVRCPLHSDVREKLRALLRELQRVEEFERELAVHRVPLPEECGNEDPERDRFVWPRPCRDELETPRVHGDRRVEADFVEVECANRLLK